MTLTGRSTILWTVRSIQRLAGLALIAAIVAPLLLFGVQFLPPNSSKLDDLLFRFGVHRFGDRMISQVGALFGITWPTAGSKSFFPLGVSFGLWLVKIGVDAIFLQIHRLIGRLIPAPLVAVEPGALRHGEAEAGSMSAESESERAALLKRYHEIEKALKTAKRKRCSFLAIDIVGSTQMKVGEKETEVAATFMAYAEMLRNIFEQYGAWKIAWTPDGVMVCFLQLELAVGAAQRVLASMKHFNETQNSLRTPFRIRCGLNLGEVPIYDDSKLEKVADHVIDVAGHMQKQGTPDTLWLSAEVYDLLPDKSGFHPTSQSVDDKQVFEWCAEAGVAAVHKTVG